MKPKDLVELAKQGGPGGEPADELARAVESILKRLRRGQAVTLPGVGKLVPEGKRQVRLEPAERQGGRRGGK